MAWHIFKLLRTRGKLLIQETDAGVHISDRRTNEAVFYAQQLLHAQYGLWSSRHEFSFSGACICLGCSVTFLFPPCLQGFYSSSEKCFGLVQGRGEDHQITAWTGT